MIAVRIASLSTRFGQDVPLPTNGIVILVGPNNVGKSLLLREISSLFVDNGPLSRRHLMLLEDIEVTTSGTTEDLRAWLESRGAAVRQDPEGREHILRGTNRLYMNELFGRWENTEGFGQLSDYLLGAQVARGRLDLLGNTSVHDPRTATPENALQRIFVDQNLEDRLSALTKRAFGFEICMNRYIQQLELRIGKPASPLTPPPAPPELLAEYESLDTVATQGDGVVAFVGLLLQIVLPSAPIVLIDEPEAFLHPPQARLLGRLLVDEAAGGQLFVATHSEDVLQGVLEGHDRPIKILRLDRRDEETSIDVLEPDLVRGLWSDPLVRYSDLLGGLFHQGTIVCEGDDDCRFYAAVLDALLGQRPYHDLLFTHVSGKGRQPKAVRALRQFKARVAAVSDFDLLRGPELRALIAAAEGEWTDELQKAHQVLESAAQQVGWDNLKRSGQAALPQGDAQNAATLLLDACRSLGVFIVPVGELERWCPDVPQRDWIVTVLEGNRHEEPSHELQQFVTSLAAFFDVPIGAEEPPTRRREA